MTEESPYEIAARDAGLKDRFGIGWKELCKQHNIAVPMTKVIFRKWKKGGDVIALFPEIAADQNPSMHCLSYQHVGQHGAATVTLGSEDTLPVTDEEAKPLWDELESIGYALKRVHCFHPSYAIKRIAFFKNI